MTDELPTTPKSQRPRCRILVVDDEPVNRSLLRKVLRRSDAEIVEAENGPQALQLVAKQSFDTVLLDVMMPGMDGYEVCRVIKENANTAHIPVILITALHGRDNKLAGIEAGADDFLTKPIDSREVQLRVRNSVRNKHLFDRLQESYTKLSKLEKMRDNLTRMIVHDMRSPLMGIHTTLQVIYGSSRQHFDEAEQKALLDARAASDNLIEMVGSMIDIRRIQQHKLPLDPKSCDLRDLAVRAVASIGSQAQWAKMSVDIPQDGAIAYCDRDVIRRVINNLISNAVKFIPQRGGEVRIFTADEGGEHITLCVADNGPGIAQEHQGTIFEMFGQVESHQTNNRRSSGLGLTFCKLAVEAHGGAIGVQSQEGHGSLFWVRLPKTEAGFPVAVEGDEVVDIEALEAESVA